MKKMILGIVLFVSGFAGYLFVSMYSVLHPITINGISGIRGFLMKYELTYVYWSCIVLGLIGLVIMAIEAYKKKNN